MSNYQYEDMCVNQEKQVKFKVWVCVGLQETDPGNKRQVKWYLPGAREYKFLRICNNLAVEYGLQVCLTPELQRSELQCEGDQHFVNWYWYTKKYDWEQNERRRQLEEMTHAQQIPESTDYPVRFYISEQ